MIDSERASMPLASTTKPILVTMGVLAALATLGASLITFDSGVGQNVFKNLGAGAPYTEADSRFRPCIVHQP
jgi:hypothetical protein